MRSCGKNASGDVSSGLINNDKLNRILKEALFPWAAHCGLYFKDRQKYCLAHTPGPLCMQAIRKLIVFLFGDAKPLLTLTNLAFLPAFFQFIDNGDYVCAFALLNAAIASIFYHSTEH